MKVHIYVGLNLFLLFCIPVHSYKNMTDEYIHGRMYVQQKFCGDHLADTMRDLCVQYNEPLAGPRARRGIIECCKTSCSYYYLMKYFCKIPRIQVDELALPGSLEAKTNVETDSRSKQQSQQVIQNSENIGSLQVRQKFVRQRKIKHSSGEPLGKRKKHKNHGKCHCVLRACKGPLLNKIHRKPRIQEVKQKSAQYGYVNSTRPPIIYMHSNIIGRGVMEYQISTQKNNQK